jgi:UDP-N-acetyl-D-glucosamine dehydrogenase
VNPHREEFLNRVQQGDVMIGVIGLGYVGLPLAVETARAGYRTLGFDTNPEVVEGVNLGRSHVADVPESVEGAVVASGEVRADDLPWNGEDFEQLVASLSRGVAELTQEVARALEAL